MDEEYKNTNTIYRYNISDDRYEELPPMKHKRDYPLSFIANSTLYVCGGNRIDSDYSEIMEKVKWNIYKGFYRP